MIICDPKCSCFLYNIDHICVVHTFKCKVYHDLVILFSQNMCSHRVLFMKFFIKKFRLKQDCALPERHCNIITIILPLPFIFMGGNDEVKAILTMLFILKRIIVVILHIVFHRSQMISQEDHKFIVAFDVPDSAAREDLLRTDRNQCARTFLNLLGHVSKDQTLQYILVLIDDMLQVKVICFQNMLLVKIKRCKFYFYILGRSYSC